MTFANYLWRRLMNTISAQLWHRNDDIVKYSYRWDIILDLPLPRYYSYILLPFDVIFILYQIEDLVLHCLIHSDEAYKRRLTSRYHFLSLLSIVSIGELMYTPYQILHHRITAAGITCQPPTGRRCHRSRNKVENREIYTLLFFFSSLFLFSFVDICSLWDAMPCLLLLFYFPLLFHSSFHGNLHRSSQLMVPRIVWTLSKTFAALSSWIAELADVLFKVPAGSPSGEHHPTHPGDDIGHGIPPRVSQSCNVDCHAKERAGRRSDTTMYSSPSIYLTPYAWRLAFFRKLFDATGVFQLAVQDAHPPAQAEGRSEKGHASRSRWCLHTTTFFFLDTVAHLRDATFPRNLCSEDRWNQESLGKLKGSNFAARDLFFFYVSTKNFARHVSCLLLNARF